MHTLVHLPIPAGDNPGGTDFVRHPHPKHSKLVVRLLLSQRDLGYVACQLNQHLVVQAMRPGLCRPKRPGSPLSGSTHTGPSSRCSSWTCGLWLSPTLTPSPPSPSELVGTPAYLPGIADAVLLLYSMQLLLADPTCMYTSPSEQHLN